MSKNLYTIKFDTLGESPSDKCYAVFMNYFLLRGLQTLEEAKEWIEYKKSEDSKNYKVSRNYPEYRIVHFNQLSQKDQIEMSELMLSNKQYETRPTGFWQGLF